MKLFLKILIFVTIGATSASASDYANMRSPVFENVERVYLKVVFMPRGMEDLPEILQQEKLEEHFLRIYTERFSSEHCKKYLVGKNAYSCDNQPVMLVPRGSGWLKRWKGDSITPELAGDDGTLNVLFRLQVIRNPLQTNPPSGTPILVYEFIHERPKVDLPIYWKQYTGMNAIPLNQSGEKIEKQILRGIEGSLDIGAP